jgi:hypothetical protein
VTTSGSYDFTISRDDIIKEAYKLLGSLEESETPSSEAVSSGARKLTLMAKAWMQKGYHLWCVQDVVLFQVLGQQSYLLGNAATDANWCQIDDYAQTTLSAAAAAGASTVALTSATGFATSDNIGIVLDSGAIQWTTATMSGTTATLGAILTGAAASGNVVFAYTTKPYRPMRVVKDSLYRRDINGNDTPVTLRGKGDYDMLTAKSQRGKTIQTAYQPFLTSGRLWTWPTADLSTDTLRFSVERAIQDFDLSTDNPDFPIEWGEALYYNLAVRLAPEEGAIEELSWLKPLADERLDEALDFDKDNASVQFQPDIRRYGRGAGSRRW